MAVMGETAPRPAVYPSDPALHTVLVTLSRFHAHDFTIFIPEPNALFKI